MIAQAGFDAYDMDMIGIHVSDTPLSCDGYMDHIKHFKAIGDESWKE